MSFYRKKPVLIEAFQWTGDAQQEEDPEWIIPFIRDGRVFFRNSSSPDVKLVIRTLEGDMTADRGDFIVKGIKGEIYPCKPDIFAGSYDKVEEAPEP